MADEADRPRVLLVEDEVLIALDMQAILEDAGFEVVGPLHDLASALQAVGDGVRLDCAVLDLNLPDGRSEAVADRLAARRTPFLFLTGQSRMDLAERFRDCPRLQKPFNEGVLVDRVRTLAAGG